MNLNHGSFADYFSAVALDYAQYRPHYPSELFAYLASTAPGRHLAWDCGTGNGQAAVALAEHFDQVVATDASPEQIAHAFPHERVTYRVEPAEAPGLETGSVDLITVALAVHWFDLDSFYRQARRVLARGGLLAVWIYHAPVITPEIDRVLAHLHEGVLADYWPERFHYVRDHYRTLPFPFEELSIPSYEMQADWDLGQLLGFINSWSGTRRYEEAHGTHPIQAVWPELAAAWGDADRTRSIRWPLFLRVGMTAHGNRR